MVLAYLVKYEKLHLAEFIIICIIIKIRVNEKKVEFFKDHKILKIEDWS